MLLNVLGSMRANVSSQFALVIAPVIQLPPREPEKMRLFLPNVAYSKVPVQISAKNTKTCRPLQSSCLRTKEY
jgi:hypothetical protein